MPVSGFTVEDYNSFYYADRMQGFGGALNWENGFSTFSYTQTPRLFWMSNWKIMGANFGAAVRIPIEYKETTLKTSTLLGNPPLQPVVKRTFEKFGLADIEVQPVLLSWNLKQFDLSVGYSFWAPTGDYDKSRFFFDNLGAGNWTHSFLLGATWYPDREKNWAVSILSHYDINMSQYSTLVNVPTSPSNPLGVASEDTTPGDVYTLEWAISKSVVKDVDIGLTGYYQQQVTSTEGPTPNGPTWQGERIHVAGIGPEIGVAFPKWGLVSSLRYDYEFTAMDHPQGHLVNLTIQKSF